MLTSETDLTYSPLKPSSSGLCSGGLKRFVTQHASIQFQSQLALLHARTATLSTGSSARLFSMSQVQQVPCDICGCYFPGRRIMLSHRARQHKEAPSLITRKDTLHAQYTLHTVDGMPTCKHCNTTFNRVDGLKMHLRGACPVLHGAAVGSFEAGCPARSRAHGVWPGSRWIGGLPDPLIHREDVHRDVRAATPNM